MKALKIISVILSLLLVGVLGCFVSCSDENGVLESSKAVEQDTVETIDGDLVNKSKIDIVNGESVFLFQLLQRITADELQEHFAEETDYGYVIKLGEFVHIDYPDKYGVREEYEWEYRITPCADGEWQVTEIYTNSKYSKIGGIALGTESEKIAEHFLNLGFHVITDFESITAISDDVTLSFKLSGDREVEISANVSDE